MARTKRPAGPITYVALLRGINVGGKNVIPMAALAATMKKTGVSSVKTYIASGNVLFKSEVDDPRALEKTIERALTKAHAYDAKVVVRSLAEMEACERGMPRTWKKRDPGWRYYVIFLRHEIDSKKVLEHFAPKPDIEQLAYGPGVLYWSADKRTTARTNVARITQMPIYKDVTIRNVTTTSKIVELMKTLA